MDTQSSILCFPHIVWSQKKWRSKFAKGKICVLTLAHCMFCARFYPSKAKVIAEKIMADELNGTVYDEEEAKNWSLNISDKVREAIHGKNAVIQMCFIPVVHLEFFS